MRAICSSLPVTPSKLKVIEWLPEPILVPLAQRLLVNPLMETALVKRAEAARSEVDHLIEEFMALARTTPVPTPTIDRLLRYYEPDAPPVPDGSAEVPLRWGGLAAALGALAGGVALLAWRVGARRRGKPQKAVEGRATVAHGKTAGDAEV
jgi:hypothetical protein